MESVGVIHAPQLAEKRARRVVRRMTRKCLAGEHEPCACLYTPLDEIEISPVVQGVIKTADPFEDVPPYKEVPGHCESLPHCTFLVDERVDVEQGPDPWPFRAATDDETAG